MSANQGPSVTRMAAVLVTPAIGAAAPPGIDRATFAKALIEDSCDLVAELEQVSPAVAVSAATEKDLGVGVAELAWPGTKVLPLAQDGHDRRDGHDGHDRRDGHDGHDGHDSRDGHDRRDSHDGPDSPDSPDGDDGPVAQTLAQLAALGAHQAAVLAADAPDLPLMLIGKLYRALGGESRRADVAVCPADGGGLVAFACWLPLFPWAARTLVAKPSDAVVELDRDDIIERLRHGAPRPSAVQIVPGWHRLRSPVDTYHLDPGLEGWSATRRVLVTGR